MKLSVKALPTRTEIKISKSVCREPEQIIQDAFEKLKITNKLFFDAETTKYLMFYTQKKISNIKRINLEKQLCGAFKIKYVSIVQERIKEAKNEPKEVKTSHIINGYSGCPITGYDFKFKYVH